MNSKIGGDQPTERRPAGESKNPKTLYPMEPDKPKTDNPSTKSSQPKKPIDLTKLKPGDAVSTIDAPQIGSRPFTVECTIQTKARDGILIAHGGTSVGYALHLKDGNVIFAIRNKNGVAQVEAALPSNPSPCTIVASIHTDGSLRLQVADQAAVTAKGSGLIPSQPKEDFCIGHDNGASVAEYSVTTTFHDIEKILVVVH
jgi:hypothetical protein